MLTSFTDTTNTNTSKMQFSTVILSAVFAMVAAAGPIANEIPSPELIARDAQTIQPRQTWCTECQGGKKTCCSALACYPPYSC